MTLMEALQRLDVLDGSQWIAFTQRTNGKLLPCQTAYVKNGELTWHQPVETCLMSLSMLRQTVTLIPPNCFL